MPSVAVGCMITLYSTRSTQRRQVAKNRITIMYDKHIYTIKNNYLIIKY